jgi:DNA-directed RNA polymerase specialized sigma24 family protein
LFRVWPANESERIFCTEVKKLLLVRSFLTSFSGVKALCWKLRSLACKVHTDQRRQCRKEFYKVTRDGFGKAYQKGYDLTVRFLLSRGVPRDSAGEAAQAAWVRGWERLAQLRNDRLVVTWINTIALNVYRSSIRREPANCELLDPPDKTVSINLAAIDVARLLTLCRPSNRRLLEQCMTGTTTAEIASEQGVSETAIRIRVLRARRDARSSLEGQKYAPRQSRNTLLMARPSAASNY